MSLLRVSILGSDVKESSGKCNIEKINHEADHAATVATIVTNYALCANGNLTTKWCRDLSVERTASPGNSHPSPGPSRPFGNTLASQCTHSNSGCTYNY